MAVRARVSQVIEAVERLAPPETCQSWDNSGLLLGDPARGLDSVLVCMDATLDTLRQAKACGAGLMLCHHPLFFDPIKALREDEPLGRFVAEAIRAGIAVYAAHTNFDICPIGTSRALAAAAGVGAATVPEGGFIAVGDLSRPVISGEIARRLRAALPSEYVCVFGERMSARVACCAGSGRGEGERALELGADVFICGELGYHEICRLTERGASVITCGHRESEAIALPALVDYLQSTADLVQYNLRYTLASSAY